MPLKVSEANFGSCLPVSQTKESRESKEDAKTAVLNTKKLNPLQSTAYLDIKICRITKDGPNTVRLRFHINFLNFTRL
jgi:hypothetical protein